MSWRILEGDCLLMMPTLNADYVDAIVCDPPYGLKFMGKQWDHGVPGVPFWEAAMRVAKPGAYLLAFGGTRTHHRLACAIEDAGWEVRDCLMWLHGQGFPKGKAQLKPAWEPIIMARKKGQLQPLNIDGCRLSVAVDEPNVRTVPSVANGGMFGKGGHSGTLKQGRWPANLVLDEEAAALLDEQSGMLKAPSTYTRNVIGHPSPAPMNRDAGVSDMRTVAEGYGDTGGASRFFFTAKASRSEREAGLEGETRSISRYSEQGQGATPQQTPRISRPQRNHHPTVKPLDLMQWLCRLVTPKGGLILDPFCGPGTTGRAAVAEGFSFVGIEQQPEYVAIAAARIAEYAPLFGGAA